jgi:PAS domain S-box-containing protein
MRALYVATDLRDADVLQQEVRRAAPKLTFDVCSGTAEARPRVAGAQPYDAMILDSSLPEHEQQQLIEYVRSRHIPLPIVILIGQGATPSSSIVSAADECISRGPRLAERLAPGLRMAIERYRVVATMTRENERLKRSEARLRLIIEAMPAGVVLVDQTGKIQAMNLAGAALVGTSGPSDVVGRDLYSLADNDGIPALRTLVAQAFEGTRGKVSFTCHGPDGELRPLQIDALCIQKDAQGQGSVLGVLSPATGAATPAEAPAAPDEEGGVDFAFANDPHSDERMALEQALEELRGEVTRLQHEAEGERARVQQVLEELERSRATAAEHHAQRTQIEERCQAAEARAEALEAQRREQDGSASALQARAEQLAGEAEGLRGDRERLQRELDDIRTERQSLQARVDAIASDRQTVQAELERTRRERGELQQAIDALRQETEKARATIAEITARAERAEHELARLAEEAASGKAGVDARVAELTAQLQAAQAKAEATETALRNDLEKMRADAVRVAEALAAEGRSRHGAEATLTAARDALQARLHELEGQSRDLESKRQAAVARVAELEEGRRAEQAELAAARKRETDLEHQLKAARDDAARSASERDGLKSELGRVHESHRAAEDDASIKASEGARARGELETRIKDLQAALEQANGARQAAQAELDRVRSDAERTRAERDAHAREVEDVKAAVAKASQVIDELRQARETMDARAAAAAGELDALRREIAAHDHQAIDLKSVLERERAEARQRQEAMAREHQDAIARLHKQIEEAREFQAAANTRPAPERGRRRQGERLGQLASAMANDLHGIVNGMADEARKLLAELPDGSQVRAQAEQSLQSANRAGQLVRHLLRLSEREARATSGSDPNGIVRANEPMLRQLAGPDIDLRFELAPSLPSVECDGDELTGVLSTLMVTVRGALPLGGSIRVTTHPPRKDGGRRRNDSSLALALIAEGYGMVPVPTTVCDEVVTRSGGTFGAQVDLKGGTTTFTAYLPIDQSAAEGVTNIA